VLLSFIDSTNPTIKSMVDGGVPDFGSVMSFFKGFENCGSYPYELVDKFLEDGRF